MGGIIWLASYPKSGNTWLRTFLHNLLLNEDQPVSLNKLNTFTIGDNNKIWYEKVTGKPFDDLSETEVSALVPQVHRAYTRTRPDSVFVKTHHNMGKHHGVPLITQEYTAGAIYVLRNPLDIVVSVADHYALHLDEAIDMLNDSGASTGGTDVRTGDYLGSWSSHVTSWKKVEKSSRHLMRYEDMLNKPEKTFGAVAKFLGLKPSKFRLKKAIKFSSFDVSRKQETEKGFIEKSDKAERFFRVGKAGQWKRILTPAQIDRIIDRHSDVMEEHGYLTKSKSRERRAE